MILQKVFLKLKSAEIADSRFMRAPAMQHAVKNCLRLFNRIAPRLPLCRRVGKGSLGATTTIHPTAIIDYPRVVIGNGCMIGGHVVIEQNTIIGNNVIIHDHAVIGSEGFELRRIAGEIVPIIHLGGVIIHDNVSIGSRTCIDKSVLGEYTEIGESTLIEENVEVGHGITIGSNVIIGGGTMIGGYSAIGDSVRIGRRCSFADGLTIGAGAVITDYTIQTRAVKPAPGGADGNPL